MAYYRIEGDCAFVKEGVRHEKQRANWGLEAEDAQEAEASGRASMAAQGVMDFRWLTPPKIYVRAEGRWQEVT